jgi:hypothetical protein
MSVLEKELGKALTPKEVATYLGIDEATVRKYYLKLGGIRVGSRYLFFERRIVDAVLQQKEDEMDFVREKGETEETGDIPHQEGGSGVRGEVAKLTCREMEKRDKFGLLSD